MENVDSEEYCWDPIDDSTIDFIHLAMYRPWKDGEIKYRLGFNPKTIADLARYRAERHGCGPADLDFLIRLGLELGDDLDEVARAVKPTDRANEFRRLRAAYGLVSGPPSRGAETAVTLSRLCSSFPTRACSYLHEHPAMPRRGGRDAVSPETMAALVPDYPPAMMTSAFAFLVPNRGDAYCALLMKAHMLHEIEAQRPFVNKRHTSKRHRQDDHNDKVVAHVVRRTLTAIAASRVAYDEQMDFLMRVGLVRAIAVEGRSRSEDAVVGTADAEGTSNTDETVAAEVVVTAEETAAAEEVVSAEEIVVAENVASAARAWDAIDSRRQLTKIIAECYQSPLKIDAV